MTVDKGVVSSANKDADWKVIKVILSFDSKGVHFISNHFKSGVAQTYLGATYLILKYFPHLVWR